MPGVSSSFIFNGSVERGSGGARHGEATGEVFCPQRTAHIAVMRCGEYQEQFGCHLISPPLSFGGSASATGHRQPQADCGANLSGGGCPNAATPAQVRRAQEVMKEDHSKPWRGKGRKNADSERCVDCGNVKGDATSSLCSTCRGKARRARRPYGSIEHHDRCVDCGNAKNNNPSPRCQQCAADLRRRRS